MHLQPASYWIDKLNLQEHTEGGFFREISHSEETVQTFDDRERHYYSSIYFLLSFDNPSHLHRLQSDELWYYHTGQTLTIHLLYSDGQYEKVLLGMNPDKGELLQYTVPKGVIFGSSIEETGGYALVSCMVSPGFDYRDFELFTQAELLQSYPQHKEVISKMAYETLPEQGSKN